MSTSPKWMLLILVVLTQAACDEAAEQAHLGLPLHVVTLDLPNGRAGEPYRAALVADGGKLPYSWHVRRGGLPAGLSLDDYTGAISGTPNSPVAGVITLQVLDSSLPVQSAALDVSLWIFDADAKRSRADRRDLSAAASRMREQHYFPAPGDVLPN